MIDYVPAGLSCRVTVKLSKTPSQWVNKVDI